MFNSKYVPFGFWGGGCVCAEFSFTSVTPAKISSVHSVLCLKTSQGQFKNNIIKAHGYHHLTNLKQ